MHVCFVYLQLASYIVAAKLNGHNICSRYFKMNAQSTIFRWGYHTFFPLVSSTVHGDQHEHLVSNTKVLQNPNMRTVVSCHVVHANFWAGMYPTCHMFNKDLVVNVIYSSKMITFISWVFKGTLSLCSKLYM